MKSTIVPSDKNKRSTEAAEIGLGKSNRMSSSSISRYNGSTTTTTTKEEAEQETTAAASNEYVLNVAFFSFLIFMITQAFFAIIAKSQSMLADSLAMSVDAFTYLFNLAAERLKHRSRGHSNPNLSVEENKRRKKMLRLYLEFIPPMISVSALIVVSVQAFIEALGTILQPADVDQEENDEPNVKMMLFFSSVNLGLDFLNVTCFSKVQDFSFLGGLNNRYEDGNGQEESRLSRQEEEEEEKALLLQNGGDEEHYQGVESTAVQVDPSPSKRRHEFPPSIFVDMSIESSFESNKISDDVNGEDMGLLGISMPNYGSQKSDNEWCEDFSLGAVYGGSTAGSLSMASSAASVETGESLESGTATGSFSKSVSSRKSRAIEIGFADELDGISEGDENDVSGDVGDVADNEDDDSDVSARGFNLNMCSAYTHVMADTMRSIAVLIAAAASFFLHLSPELADAVAAIIVSIIIAVSLGPLIVGLMKTWHEIRIVRRELRESTSTEQQKWQIHLQSPQ